MLFLIFTELVVAALVVLFVISQIILPLVNGTKVFPLFRRSHTEKERELKDELSDLRQKAVEVQLQREVKSVKDNLKGKK